MKKTILITGCSTGIGYAAAIMLKERGYTVFASARKDEDVQKLAVEGFNAVQLDVSSPASIQEAVEKVMGQTGHTLDALVNNAGYIEVGAVEDMSQERLHKQFATNLFGLQALTKLIIPIMRKQGHGRIINISSILGFISMPFRGAYNASKYALEGLSDTLRLELYDTDIFVSLIEPGPIESDFRKTALKSYQSHLVDIDSHFKQHYQAMLDSRRKDPNKKSPFNLGPEAVVKKIIHALESKRPKPRYYVTMPTHIMAILKRLLPSRAMDWVLYMASRDELKIPLE